MLGFGRTSLLNTTDPLSPCTIDWASLGQSEFDLLGTSVSASRSRPDTQLVINFETLGRSDMTMPGDETGMEMEMMTSHVVTTSVTNKLHDVRAKRKNKKRSAADTLKRQMSRR